MDGSYPMIFKDKLAGIVKDFDFFSCSGDVLDDIDAQLGKMLGIHADAVSLSISGNDFLFGKVVVSGTISNSDVSLAPCR